MNPFQPRPFSQGDLAKVIETTRNTTIEECARVVDGPRIELKNQDRRPHEEPIYQLLTSLAAAIRALKRPH